MDCCLLGDIAVFLSSTWQRTGRVWYVDEYSFAGIAKGISAARKGVANHHRSSQQLCVARVLESTCQGLVGDCERLQVDEKSSLISPLPVLQGAVCADDTHECGFDVEQCQWGVTL